MTPFAEEDAYSLMDVIVGLAVFSVVVLSIYSIYKPTFALSQDINDRLATQQDVRLTLDRLVGVLHETVTAPGRLRIYSSEAGCAGAYEACLGFVTARDADCSGTFQLIGGAPNWQATLYLWRDVASSELRLRCELSTTFPTANWPPRTLEPFVVIGTHIAATSITLLPSGSRHPTSIAIAIREVSRTSLRRSPTTFFNETFFLPQNR